MTTIDLRTALAATGKAAPLKPGSKVRMTAADILAAPGRGKGLTILGLGGARATVWDSQTSPMGTTITATVVDASGWPMRTTGDRPGLLIRDLFGAVGARTTHDGRWLVTFNPAAADAVLTVRVPRATREPLWSIVGARLATAAREAWQVALNVGRVSAALIAVFAALGAAWLVVGLGVTGLCPTEDSTGCVWISRQGDSNGPLVILITPSWIDR